MNDQPSHRSYDEKGRLDGLLEPKTQEGAGQRKAKSAYVQSPNGRLKVAEAQKRYFQTEKGKEARRRASQRQAEKRRTGSEAFGRKVLREVERIRLHLKPMLDGLTPEGRQQYAQRAEQAGNHALVEALRREGY